MTYLNVTSPPIHVSTSYLIVTLLLIINNLPIYKNTKHKFDTLHNSVISYIVPLILTLISWTPTHTINPF